MDVLDGILPAVTLPKNAAEQRQYQEERRLFYVAMTRAKDHLFLFSCLDRDSMFIGELQQELPVEAPEPDDVFGTLATSLCGKRYHHAQNGQGTVRAFGEGRCVIAYPGGEMQFLTIGQMLEQRMVVRKKPVKPVAAAKRRPTTANGNRYHTVRAEAKKLSPSEKAALIGKAVQGRKIIHSSFGAGIIISYAEPIVTIRFIEHGEKKFVLLDSFERGLLHYEEDRS